MIIFLNLLALLIAAFYFFGIGGFLVFALLDKQKDSTVENKVVAIVLFLALIVMPALGVFYSLR